MAGMVVQHNMNALNAYNRLNVNVNGLKKSSEKLSSGYRINRAGDDAAGLAISEKMRSQIRGLNQAKRNSQDGISMIQTFEGAAQETHAILQRMKELATESANGTYDNATDRAAIQLEFDQLNDELNQIADTDFNGTIVMNGGEMADGLKAVDGEFNYANYIRDPKQLSAADVKKVDFQILYDDADNTNVTKANTVWKDLNAAWSRTDNPTSNDGPDSVDVMLKYDETGGADGNTFWKIEGATNGADSAALTVTSTANGGFKLSTGSVANFVDVVVDHSTLINGDTITLTLNNPNAGVAKPSNIGVEEISSTFVEGTAATAIKESDADLATTITAPTTMTAASDRLFKALDGAQVTTIYNANTAAAVGDIEITLNDDDNTVVKASDLTGNKGVKSVYVDGVKTDLYLDFTTAGELTVSLSDGATTSAASATGGNVAFAMQSKNSATTQDSTGKITYKVGIARSNYDTSATPNVEVKAPLDSAVSESNSFTNSTARMTYSDHIVLQTGARTKDSVDFTFNYNADNSADMGDLKANLNISARADGLNTENLSLATQDDANYAIDQIDKAINKVSMVRASFGSIQNRLEHKIENITTTAENLTEAESTIRDTDMASEMMNYTKFNILQQAAQSMLAQANQQPQGILQLLG